MAETPAATDETTTDEPPADASDASVTRSGPSRPRRIIAWVLIVLASFLAFGTAADVWVKQQLLDTQRWVRMSDEILAQPKVQAALADYIVDEIYSNVDVQDAIAEQLPADFKGIAGPLAGALRGPATTGIEKVLASTQVQRIWATVNEDAHRTLVNVLEDKMQYGTSKDGKVVLDLGEIVKTVATQMGLPKAVVDRIPADAGQVTIFQSDQLALVQRSVAILRVMGPILVVLVLALYAVAVWINRGRRIRTLRNIGWAIVIVGLVIVVARRLLGNYVVSMIPTSQYVPAGGLVYTIITKMLHDIGWMLAGWGALVVLGMLFVGPSRAAHAIRRWLAPVLNAEPVVFWIGAAVIYVLVVWVAPTPALQVWWSVLLVAALGACYLEVVRRRTRIEFPDSHLELGGMGGRASHVWDEASGWVRGAVARVGDRRTGGDAGGGSADDHVAQLQRLASLHASGSLSDEEFAAAKKKLLD